jgi:hypothetical protein
MNRCYVTLLSGGLGFLPGVAILNQSLRRVSSRYPLMCLIERPIACREVVEYLEFLGVIVKVVEPLRYEGRDTCACEEGRFDTTFSKLHVVNPSVSRLDKVVFLDSDIVVTQCIDGLFDMAGFSACMSTMNAMSGAVVVVEPSVVLWEQSCQILVSEPDNKFPGVGGDEYVWNRLMPGWVSREELHIEDCYNVLYYPFANKCHWRYSSIVYDDIKALHWGGILKYWSLYRGDMHDDSDASKVKRYIASLEKEITDKLTEAQFSTY